MNKFVEPRPYADPEAAARKLLEIASASEPHMDGRILIERLNGPMLFEFKATAAEYKAGLDCAIANGWSVLHESGTFVRFTQAVADLFAYGQSLAGTLIQPLTMDDLPTVKVGGLNLQRSWWVPDLPPSFH